MAEGGDPADLDLETIDLGGGADPLPLRRRWPRKRRLTYRPRAVVLVLTIAIVAVSGLLFAAMWSTRRGGRAASTDNTQTSVSTRPTTGPIQPVRVRTLFTRTSPNGITVVGRAGRVRVAEANGCSLAPIPPGAPLSRYCTNDTAPGIEFDFASGGRTYRVTVLSLAAPAGSLRPMNLASSVREVWPGGITFAVHAPVQLAVLRANRLDKVRINPRRSVRDGRDEMTPVDGWVAFPGLVDGNLTSFDVPVHGIDAHGDVVTTAVPYRCC